MTSIEMPVGNERNYNNGVQYQSYTIQASWTVLLPRIGPIKLRSWDYTKLDAHLPRTLAAR